MQGCQARCFDRLPHCMFIAVLSDIFGKVAAETWQPAETDPETELGSDDLLCLSVSCMK